MPLPPIYELLVGTLKWRRQNPGVQRLPQEQSLNKKWNHNLQPNCHLVTVLPNSFIIISVFKSTRIDSNYPDPYKL